MSPVTRKIIGFLLLVFVAMPTGLASIVNTSIAIKSFRGDDAWDRGLGIVQLILSGVGYVICGLSIWGAIRLARPRTANNEPYSPRMSPLSLVALSFVAGVVLLAVWFALSMIQIGGASRMRP
jgi:hypothetical protein